MLWFKNEFKVSPRSKRHNQLWYKRWTGYRKFKLLELLVWLRYENHEMWLRGIN